MHGKTIGTLDLCWHIDILYCEKKLAYNLYPPTASGSYSRQAGRQVSRRNTGGFQNF